MDAYSYAEPAKLRLRIQQLEHEALVLAMAIHEAPHITLQPESERVYQLWIGRVEDELGISASSDPMDVEPSDAAMERVVMAARGTV